MPRPASAKHPKRAPSAAKVEELRGFLDDLMLRYHRPEFLGTDPLAMVHALPPGLDREVGALLAALLAYGNVKQIQRSLNILFTAMDGRPGRFVSQFNHHHAAAALDGFKHRFTTADDVLALCHLLHEALAGADSLEPFFLRGCRFDDETDLALAAGRFVENLCAQDFGAHLDRETVITRTSFKHLLPRADHGSAAKRVHLWLRWMVRPADGVDLGLWRTVPASHLLVPVDTHLLRLGRHLGFTRLTTHSLAASREITAALRRVHPTDPTRYDFALCRLGILQACPTASRMEACLQCELRLACTTHRRLARKPRHPLSS
ncbi:TIGR02757 family protein [candidate division BRC1 bacterium HGW-BRC1-1]|nr:MAG: TIGR02757 family protein [candidate division BRC1 bacterium HGW-BRC1-1]